MFVRILNNDRREPPHKLADVEIVFDEGPLEGLKLVGTAVWATQGADGEVSITFPARSFQGREGLRYYNFLRPEADRAAMERFKEVIKEEYRRARSAAA